jgi:hypothetical protein
MLDGSIARRRTAAAWLSENRYVEGADAPPIKEMKSRRLIASREAYEHQPDRLG